MCTLIAYHRCDPHVPLAVAANRDEWLERPSEGIRLRDLGGVGVLAPLDLRAGGTWLGLNQYGVFAAVTNRPGANDPARRSRGMLVSEVLACRGAPEAAELLAGLPPRTYNGFNLFVADGKDAATAVYDDASKVEECRPGVHLIGNADPNDREHPKVGRLLREAERVAEGRPEDWLPGLQEICRGHDGEPPYGAACVHAGDYGTKSSTLLRLESSGAGQLLHAAGPPCSHEYQDESNLLARLRNPGAPRERTSRRDR